MKTIVKRITAAVLAVATTMALCITANAAKVEQVFTATRSAVKYKLIVETDHDGSLYSLKSKAVAENEPAYIYPELHVQAILYATDGGNAEVATRKETYQSSASVIAYLSETRCKGRGYGYFLGTGISAYGDVYGIINMDYEF